MIMTTSEDFLIMLRLRCHGAALVFACPAAVWLPLCHPMKGVTRSPSGHSLVAESLRALSWYQVGTPTPSAADWVSLKMMNELFFQSVGQSPAPPPPRPS